MKREPIPSLALVEAVAATTELCGSSISPAAARLFVQDLAGFPEQQVMAALARCRQEVSGRLTVAHVLARLDDGRPGADEAFSMLPRNEVDSYPMTDEMRAAWGIVIHILSDRSQQVTAARAFREAYVAEINKARMHRRPVSWFISFGSDPAGREQAIADALAKGRIGFDYADALLPPGRALQILPPERRAALPAPAHLGTPPDPEARRQLQAALKMITGKAPRPRAGGGGQSDPDAGG